MDCTACRENPQIDDGLRRRLGCGWLAPAENAQPWAHPGMSWKPTGCVGYTTELPEVVDVAMAFPFFETGQLELLTPAPPRALLDGLVLLKVAAGDVTSWRKKNPPKNGQGG